MAGLEDEIAKLREAKKSEAPTAELAGAPIKRRSDFYSFAYGWINNAVHKVTYADGRVGDFHSHDLLIRDTFSDEQWVFHFSDEDKQNLIQKMTGGVVPAHGLSG